MRCLATGGDRTDEVGPLQRGQGGELVLQSGGGGRIGTGHRADDDLRAIGRVNAPKGLAGRTGLEHPRAAEALAKPAGLVGR